MLVVFFCTVITSPVIGRQTRKVWAAFATNMHILDAANPIRQLIFNDLNVEHAIHTIHESQVNGSPVFEAMTHL